MTHLGYVNLFISARRHLPLRGVALSRVLVFRSLLRTIKCDMAKTRTIYTPLSLVIVDTFTRPVATIKLQLNQVIAAIKASYFCSFIAFVKLSNIVCGRRLRLVKFRALFTYLMLNLEFNFKRAKGMATEKDCFILWSIWYAVIIT